MTESSQIEGVTIYDDEELLHHVESSALARYVTPLHVGLTLFTFGFWLPVPVILYFLNDDAHTEYVVTDNRVVVKRGLVGSSTEQISFDEIVGDVTTRQSALRALFDVGDVEFEIQKTRETSGMTGEFGDRERNKRDLDVDRRTIQFERIKNHQSVADSVRRLHNQS